MKRAAPAYEYKNQIKQIEEKMKKLKSKLTGEHDLLDLNKTLLIREMIKGGEKTNLFKNELFPVEVKLDKAQMHSITSLVDKRQNPKLSLAKAILIQRRWFRMIKNNRISGIFSNDDPIKDRSMRNNRRVRIFKTGRPTISKKLARDIKSSSITDWSNTRLEYITICLNALLDFLKKFIEETRSQEIAITTEDKIKEGQSVKIPNIFETNYNLFLEKTINSVYLDAISIFNNYIASSKYEEDRVIKHFTHMLLIAKKIYKERLYSDFELLESITSLLLNNKDKYEFGVCLFTLRSFIESSKWETGSVFALRIDFSSKDEYLVPNETYWSIFDSKLVQMLFFLKDSNYENRRRVLKSLKALHVICLDRLAIWDTIYSPYAGEEGKDLMKRPINVISEPSMISDFIYYYQDASCPSVQNRVFKDYNDYHSKEKTFLRNTFNEFSSRMNHALAGGHVQRILYVFEDSYEYLKNKLDKLVTEDLLLVKIIKNWKALVQIISVSPVDMISAETLKKEIDKLSSKIFDEPKLEFHARGNLYRAIIESAKKEPVFDGRMMNILRDYHAYVTSKKLGMNVDTFKRFTGWVKRQNK